TIRGARKRDHPQSFSYHEPWWSAYHVSARYFARLSAALAQGEQVNRVLVLEPTTTAWMYQGDEPKLKELGDSFFNLLMGFEAAQIEYDIGCEDVLARHGTIEDGRLKVGCRTYEQVILPPFTETINGATRALLDKIPVFCCGKSPERVDGALIPSGPVLARLVYPANPEGWQRDLVQSLRQRDGTNGFYMHRDPGDNGILFHHRRELDKGELLFLVNTSAEHASGGTFHSRFKGVERWDLYTGRNEPYQFTNAENGIDVRFDLPPSGSLLLLLSPRPTQADPTAMHSEAVVCNGPVEVERLEPNILTLDYVDLRAAGESRTNIYCYQANQLAWKANGMERDPWDSAVQFKDEFIRRRFKPESGFEADYHFTIQGAVPPDLEIVIERADLYSIACNGRPVKPEPNGWWLDKAFNRIPLGRIARTGPNVVTLKTAPFSMFHELEPAYVRGTFSLMAVDRGFEIVSAQPLELSANENGGNELSGIAGLRQPAAGWNAQGCPFYSGSV
ncbi:MAG TPA: hypothetical protein VHI52_05505, partial [Verrucomicrobiae bacterium]|nr:hypothetical protein [Verrucomicrobiae bacterium]